MKGISDVSLSAQTAPSTDALQVRYTIKNGSAGDIYVLDGKRSGGAGGEPTVTTSDYALFLAANGEAKVLVGIAPLPGNKLVTVRIMPVGTRLAPGATLTRELQAIPLPLTQHTPYVTAEELRAPEIVSVARLVLGVHFIRASVPSLTVTPLPYDATHFEVKTPRTVADAEEAEVVLQQAEMQLRIVPRAR